jgi:hypothetical protein
MEELKESLLTKEEKRSDEIVQETPNSQRIDLAVGNLKSKKEVDEKYKQDNSKNDKNSWKDDSTESRGIMYTLRWTLPYLWQGGFWIKF